MSRLVERLHDRWEASGSRPSSAPVQTNEAAELARRVEALRRLDKRFAHVCLSGFTEESDGRRVLGKRGRIRRIAIPA